MDLRFTGVDYMTVDNKGRVGIPAKFMAVLRALCPEQASEVGVLITPEHAIKVLPLPEFQAELARIEQMSDQLAEQRMLKRLTAMSADRLPLDKQNRIKLNPVLMKLCSITRDVVITGAFSHMEIFDEKRWNDQTAKDLALMAEATNNVAKQQSEVAPVQQFVINVPGNGNGNLTPVAPER